MAPNNDQQPSQQPTPPPTEEESLPAWARTHPVVEAYARAFPSYAREVRAADARGMRALRHQLIAEAYTYYRDEAPRWSLTPAGKAVLHPAE